MSATTNGYGHPTANDVFGASTRTRIAQLAIGQPEPDSLPYIEAVVSLIWPYSNNTGAISLLLAEPDVRLRTAKGQLKVTFHGAGAREVARTHIGIGDYVRLRLDNSTWTFTGEAVSTPGKKVDWDLHFKNRVILDIRRNGSPFATINFSREDTPPPTLTLESTQNGKLLQIEGGRQDTAITFSKPTSTKPIRLSSGSFVDASLDPFADDDGFVLGKGRKKTKFGRTSGSWRLIDDVEDANERDRIEDNSDELTRLDQDDISSIEGNGQPNVIVLDDDGSPEPSSAPSNMPPPITPFRKPRTRPGEAPYENEQVLTPRLHPLPSPGLPLVSPLIKNVSASFDYFGPQQSGSSELDAISVTSTSPTDTEFSKQAQLSGAVTDGTLGRGQNDQSHNAAAPAEVQSPSFSDVIDEIPSPTFRTMFDSHQAMSSSGSYNSQTESNTQTFTGAPLAGGSFGGLPRSMPPAEPSVATGASSLNYLSGSSLMNSAPLEAPGPGANLGFHLPTMGIDDADAERAPYQAKPQALIHQQSLTDRNVERPQSANEHAYPDADDVYGPAQHVQPATAVAKISPREPQLDEWEGFDDKTDFGADLKANEPPSSLDGARNYISDDDNENSDSDQQHAAGSALSQDSFEEIEDTQVLSSSNVEFVDLTSPISRPAVQDFGNLTRAHLTLGPMLDLEGVPPQQVRKKSSNVPDAEHYERDDNKSTSQATREDQYGETTAEERISREYVDKGEVKQINEETRQLREQIMTPENTQLGTGDRSSFEMIEHVPSRQMPPTPDNTQEPTDLPRTDGAPDFYDGEEAAISISTSAKKAITRSSQKALDSPETSSAHIRSRKISDLPPEGRRAADGEVMSSEDTTAETTLESSIRLDRNETHDRLQPAMLSPSREKLLRPIVGMSTALSYYTPLPSLVENFDQLVDVLAVCTTDSSEPVRSKAGPKDYTITLHLADTFSDDASTVTAQIFRPYMKSLPIVRRGQVVLLRSFKVQSLKRKMTLLSTDSSAWVVFSPPDGNLKDDELLDLTAQVLGPPVEYGSEEIVIVKELMTWWDCVGSGKHPVLPSRKSDKAIRSSRGEDPNMSPPSSTMAADQVMPTATMVERDILLTNSGDGANLVDPNPPPRATRSSRRSNNRADNIENVETAQKEHTATNLDFNPTSPTRATRTRRKMNQNDNVNSSSVPIEAQVTPPISPTRLTRSSQRLANHTGNDARATATDNAEQPLPEMPSPKTSRRPRRSTSALSPGPEQSRNLRSQVIVHELRDGTKYVDGHVPTKNDGIHELRDGTKYVDENISPAEKTHSAAGGGRSDGDAVVHELRDGTNYVDRGKPPQEVRRSARNKRGGSVVHELRDGVKYTD